MRPTASASLTLCLATLALACTGCKSGITSTTNRSGGYQSSKQGTPEQADTQYKQTLAQTCGPKHLEGMSPDQLSTLTHAWYSKLDAPARDEYDKAIRVSCGANASQPDCYNKGILIGAAQDGSLQTFVNQACAPTPQ